MATRELYGSANGDRWFLICDPAGHVHIRHEANLPPDEKVTNIEIGAFLSEGQRDPEHQALLRRIGTLVDGDLKGSCGTAQLEQ